MVQSLYKGFVFARVGDKNVAYGHPSSDLVEKDQAGLWKGFARDMLVGVCVV
jgi:hypothetical protein